jgi:hypothetical protein
MTMIIRAQLKGALGTKGERVESILTGHGVDLRHVDWNCMMDDDSEAQYDTTLEFWADDAVADRICSELRCCGFVVGHSAR